jgi:hypothetical protein
MGETWVVSSDELAMEESILTVEFLGQCVETVKL